MTTTLTIQETGTTLTVASTLRMTASEAETLLDGVFEPVLGNPGTNGYVLSSTTAGVRSWVATASDVDGITTTTGSSTNMLRVAAAGGLEYRTTAQVLSDIGAAPTASPTFTGTVTLPTTVASIIKPASDSTTALQLANAAGSAVLTVDTTGNVLDVSGAFKMSGQYIRHTGTSHLYFDWNGGGTGGNLYFRRGSVLTSTAQLSSNGYFSIGSHSPTAYADIAASTTAAASLRIRSGTAPTSPNAGDIWFDGTNLKFYDGTTTRTLSWT